MRARFALASAVAVLIVVGDARAAEEAAVPSTPPSKAPPRTRRIGGAPKQGPKQPTTRSTAPAVPAPGPAGSRLLAPVRPGPALPISPARPPARAATVATVLSVAGGRAYLDAGATDGLAIGHRLSFRRKGREAGTCTIDAVVEHTAACAATDLRPGDTAPLATTAKALEAEPPTLPAPLPAAESERRLGVIESAPIQQVQYVAPPEQRSVHDLERIQATLLHTSWIASDSAARHQERVELRIRGAEVGAGWRLFADASGVYRGTPSADRFRPDDTAYLEVRELQLSMREADRALAVSVGRVLPWSTPGTTVFDGAQVGWRNQDGELGVFGGVVPDPLTTNPTTDRATGGLYGSIESASEERLLRGEGRVAAVKSPELGTRMETEVLGHAWLSRTVDLSAQARFGFGGTRTAPGYLDAGRIDLSARMGPTVWITGGYRHVGLFVAETGAPALFAGPSRHADATVSWDATTWLTLRATGGYGRDVESGLDRGFIGPEIALPHLFGNQTGLAAGWIEERGWAAGRSVWLQFNADALAGFRLLARGSLFMDERPAPYAQESTVGLALTAIRDLASWLRFRLSGMGRYDLTLSSENQQLYGVTFLAALDAIY